MDIETNVIINVENVLRDLEPEVLGISLYNWASEDLCDEKYFSTFLSEFFVCNFNNPLKNFSEENVEIFSEIIKDIVEAFPKGISQALLFKDTFNEEFSDVSINEVISILDPSIVNTYFINCIFNALLDKSPDTFIHCILNNDTIMDKLNLKIEERNSKDVLDDLSTEELITLLARKNSHLI